MCYKEERKSCVDFPPRLPYVSEDASLQVTPHLAITVAHTFTVEIPGTVVSVRTFGNSKHSTVGTLKLEFLDAENDYAILSSKEERGVHALMRKFVLHPSTSCT